MKILLQGASVPRLTKIEYNVKTYEYNSLDTSDGKAKADFKAALKSQSIETCGEFECVFIQPNSNIKRVFVKTK